MTNPKVIKSASLAVLFAGGAWASLMVPSASAQVFFSETFDSYTGSALGVNITATSNLTPIGTGSYRVYQDNDGTTGTRPDVLLFPDAGVSTFLNLNNARVGTTNSYNSSTAGTFNVNFTASMQSGATTGVFNVGSGTQFMQLEWRTTARGATDGLLARIYNNGFFQVWNGSTSGASLGTFNGTGIGSTGPFTLSLRDTGSNIAFFANGAASPFFSLNTTVGNANAGFITFGNTASVGLKIDSVSVIPEPSTIVLLLGGLACLFVLQARSRKNQAPE